VELHIHHDVGCLEVDALAPCLSAQKHPDIRVLDEGVYGDGAFKHRHLSMKGHMCNTFELEATGYEAGHLFPLAEYDHLLLLTFENLLDEKFHGGSFRLLLVYPEKTYDPQSLVEIPSIDEKQSRTVRVPSLVSSSAGNCGLGFEYSYFRDEKGTYEVEYLYDEQRDHLKTQETYINFPVISREELYQKYSVVVALWVATASIAISAIGIVIQVLKP